LFRREDASIWESAQGDVEPRPTSPCTGRLLLSRRRSLTHSHGRRKGELRATAELAGARGRPRTPGARRSMGTGGLGEVGQEQRSVGVG
jgi:hypothetical protein